MSMVGRLNGLSHYISGLHHLYPSRYREKVSWQMPRWSRREQYGKRGLFWATSALFPKHIHFTCQTCTRLCGWYIKRICSRVNGIKQTFALLFPMAPQLYLSGYLFHSILTNTGDGSQKGNVNGPLNTFYAQLPYAVSGHLCPQLILRSSRAKKWQAM